MLQPRMAGVDISEAMDYISLNLFESQAFKILLIVAINWSHSRKVFNASSSSLIKFNMSVCWQDYDKQ